MIKYRNPENDYIETSSAPWLWCLLFGSLYFLVKEVYKHFFISAILAILTGGISWLIYPFFAKGIITHHYESKGWIKHEQILPKKVNRKDKTTIFDWLVPIAILAFCIVLAHVFINV